MAPLYIGPQAFKVYLGSVDQKVYQGADLIVAGLEDGSLVIEDDTLDVAGGGTVNMRVKLGAQPGSDVVVAASESIDGVSISPASRTYTRDNWDTFQSFVVTADTLGNLQEISLGDVGRFGGGGNRGWAFQSDPRPQIISALTPSLPRYLILFFLSSAGRLVLNLTGTPTGPDASLRDLTDEFESNGSITLTLGLGETFTANLDGADMAEPYDLTPDNSDDVAAVWAAMVDEFTGTLILRDYDAFPSGPISLSASGPDEYAGVTDSATVTVT